MGNNWIKECLVHRVIRKVHCKTEISNFQAISRASCCVNWKIKSLFPSTTHVIFHGGEAEHRKQVIKCDVRWCVPIATLPEPKRCGWQSLGHLGKDNNSTRRIRREEKNQKPSNVKKIASSQRQSYPVQDMGPAATPVPQAAPAARGALTLCSSLLWKTRLAGDNASWNREFEATLDILGCWASEKEFSEYVSTVPWSATHTNEKVRQVSGLTLPYLFWKTSVESEWVTVPLPNHLFKKKKIEGTVLLYVKIKHRSLFSCSEEME